MGKSEHTVTEITRTILEDIADDDASEERSYSQQAIDLSGLKKTYSAIPSLGRRVAPRYALRFSVVVYSWNQSVRTESVNISSSGALLKDSLPTPFMKGTFEIMFLIKEPRSRKVVKLFFKAKAIGVGSKSQRISFESSASNALMILQNLFRGLEPLT